MERAAILAAALLSACQAVSIARLGELADEADVFLEDQEQDQGQDILPPMKEAEVFFNEQGQDTIPPTKQLQALFAEKAKSEDRFQEPLPGAVQLVLGVFSTRYTSRAVLDVHRTAWMRRQGVCPLPKGPRPNCTVYAAFVYGDSLGLRARAAADELSLNTTENMNSGKSFDFFAHAAQSYSWATHIGKMDLDTFPHVFDLTSSLRGHDDCSLYFGTPMDYERCAKHEWCPPQHCGLPLRHNFMHYSSQDPQCWSYMQGGLYILSSQLARAITGPNSWWNGHRSGPEDLMTGRAVAEYARRTGGCVSTWDSWQAFDHLPTLQWHHS